MGEMAQVEKFLLKIEAIASGMDPYHWLSGWYSLLRGDFDRSLAMAEQSLRINIECGAPFQEILARQLLAKILHEKGEHKSAIQQVSITKKRISEMGNSPLFTYFSLLDQAHFLFDASKDGAALRALRSAFALRREYQYRTLANHWRPTLLARLCVKALESDIEVTYVQDLIRTLNLISETPPIDIDRWPWAIRIYALGKFELQRDGKTIVFSRKMPAKPLDLLKVLLAHGGKNVREETLTDIVWPESTGDAAHHSFEVNLQRLRSLLGYPQALQLHDGHVTLDPHYCWVDVWAFEQLLEQAKNADTPDETLRASSKATGMYAGHFLAGETDAVWVLPLRERLKSRFVENIRSLGQHYECAGRWQEALDCYRAGLEADDLIEEIYRCIMICCLHLGKKSEALSVYARCKRMLSLIFGITPSLETEKLYRSIKESR
jgi:LuxR family transcriptional regulator, maltose regulon positive regulatory protein